MGWRNCERPNTRPGFAIGDRDAARFDAVDVIERLGVELIVAAHGAERAAAHGLRRRIAGGLHSVFAAYAIAGERRQIAIAAHQGVIIRGSDVRYLPSLPPRARNPLPTLSRGGRFPNVEVRTPGGHTRITTADGFPMSEHGNNKWQKREHYRHR
jgi:hypothetical protein